MEESEVKQIGQYIYSLKNILCKGNFSSVYQGRNIDKTMDVAIKVMDRQELNSSPGIYHSLLNNEYNTLKSIKEEGIIKLIDAYKTKNNFYFVLEYCDGGTLQDLLYKVNNLTEDRSLEIIRQIAQTFVNIENLQLVDKDDKKLELIHRDIKPANILLKNGSVKIGDFGFAQLIKENQCLKAGSLLYMSPQIIDGKPYGNKTDIWSTGVMLYQMIFGCYPWNIEKNQASKILATPLTFSAGNIIKEQTQDLIKNMLIYDENDRLTWKKVYQHPALKPKIKILIK